MLESKKCVIKADYCILVHILTPISLMKMNSEMDYWKWFQIIINSGKRGHIIFTKKILISLFPMYNMYNIM